MTALDRLKSAPSPQGAFTGESLVDRRTVYTKDLDLVLAVVEAAQAIHDSGHNGNLYANEYNALTDALSKLTT